MAKITENCIKLVKEFEGCYLKAYKDEVGVWTIGYGITNSDKSITGTTIKQGLVITKKQADAWLRKSLEKKYLPLVTKYNSKYNWNQNQIMLCFSSSRQTSIDFSASFVIFQHFLCNFRD